jgi:hypothetical protein
MTRRGFVVFGGGGGGGGGGKTTMGEEALRGIQNTDRNTPNTRHFRTIFSFIVINLCDWWCIRKTKPNRTL